MNKFKVGDRVKVVSQGWHKPSLIGKVGIVAYILSGSVITHYGIFFDNWHEGHCGNLKSFEITLKNEFSFWNLGERLEDKIILASEQLEFNFDA
jgi:hypothetical protein